ncbi:MAG TPA: FGGY family carbohydrate kinase, partial [Isosphaeraceae bacterium]|nr:FGGY family carbohydrate kinase [Isosphaeraceae bacterium]
MPEAAPPYLLGLDVGTQSLRAAIVDTNGRTVAFGVSPIETAYPRPTWAQQDPLQWWTAAQLAVRQALQQGGVTADQIAGIGLDCTACTVVACDLAGNPLRPALLWMDQRAFREADAISATQYPVLRYVSGRVSPEWMLPKALWLRHNEPDVYHHAGRIVECTNWMMHRLTGEWTLSLNHIAVKWNYARPEGGWPRDILKAVGLEDLLDKWPEQIVPLGRGEAVLSQTAAEALGLRAGTPVAQGGIDAYLGMLGLGATGPGDVAVIVGSSTCHLAMSCEGIFGSGASGCFPDATVEGLYTLEAGQTATGSILNWYRHHFAAREQAEADRLGVSVFQILDQQAEATPPGADGLLVRDDWQGNRSPYKNPQARGVITG